MDKTQEQEQPKKCFCARCFLPIEPGEKVDVEGQNFHKACSMCCICRTIPTSIKMFYGHVFCNECFKTHVLNRFKGENPRMHSNSWWMQWAPGVKPQENKDNSENKDEESKPSQGTAHELPKKCICARCLQVVDESNKIDIGGQSFHTQCAKCCFCHCVPTNNVKIYYGQVFCEDCFNRHVMNRNKENPSEFFKSCFDQWQSNPQFAENMKEFMAGNKDNTPFVFMMQGAQPNFCRCGGTHAPSQEWCQNCSEQRKSATPASISIGEESSTWDLSFENRTEVSDLLESCNESANNENSLVGAAEKIEKLTKYLHENSDSKKRSKKWKNFLDQDIYSMASGMELSLVGWVNLQDPKMCKDDVCPKCLWQCGPIFVNGDYFQKDVAE